MGNIEHRIVGLDLSLTSSGVATVDGEFAVRPKSKGMERLAFILDEVWEHIDTDSFVAIEGYAYNSRNSNYASALGELGGLVRFNLWKEDIPYVDIPPTCRSKFAAGRGTASKSDVISHLTMRTGRIWEGAGADDRADAWVLREMVLAKLDRSNYEWPKKNLEALDKVDWTALEGWCKG